MRRWSAALLLLLLIAAPLFSAPHYSETRVLIGPINRGTVGATFRDTGVVFVEGKGIVDFWVTGNPGAGTICDSTITFQTSMDCTTWTTIGSSAIPVGGMQQGLRTMAYMSLLIGGRTWASSQSNSFIVTGRGDSLGAPSSPGILPKCLRCIVLWQSDADSGLGGAVSATDTTTVNARVWVRTQEPAGR